MGESIEEVLKELADIGESEFNKKYLSSILEFLGEDFNCEWYDINDNRVYLVIKRVNDLI